MTDSSPSDRIETLGRSLIQHGPLSDRVYLMKLHPEDSPRIIGDIAALCATAGYTKVFAKVPASCAESFVATGYREEARVPGFFRGGEDGLFLATYPADERAIDERAEETQRNIALAEARKGEGLAPDADEVPIIEAGPELAEELAEVYAEVFPSYPFPIHDPAYLRETMRTHVVYFCVRDDAGRVVAVSSAEMDEPAQNVEMTDFATLPSQRGKALALHLLARMEREMRERGLRTAYTIARSRSAGMNITFARAGYSFSGTLVNNTNISGQIESMNVWHKPL